MDDTLKVALGLLIPLLGTSLGAAMVFLMKKEVRPALQKGLLGFASGIMLAASVWSLLLPSIEMAEESGKTGWIPAAVGFLLGVGFLLLLDTVIPHLHATSDEPEGMRSDRESKSLMLVLAVTLHNIPEGMAVGVVFAGMLAGDSVIPLTGALALAVGIAIQNFPEGAMISMPLAGNGMSKPKAFGCGFLSGVVEPIGAIITILLTSLITPVLPYILSFAAGAMVYVIVDELIPESHEGEHSNIATICVALGFALMMILDIALG